MILTIGMIVSVQSCSKNNSNSSTGLGTWSIKNATYTSISDTFDRSSSHWSILRAQNTLNTADSGYNSLIVSFPPNVTPTTGTYTVLEDNGNNFPSGNSVIINIRYGSNGSGFYSSTAGGNNNTVQVSVSGTGKISVSGSNIEMISDGYLYRDPANPKYMLNFNITQQ